MEKEKILQRVGQQGLRLVRFLYCGNDGVIRGKAVSDSFLEAFIDSGIGLPVAVQSHNVLDCPVAGGTFGPVGEIRLVPDLGSFAVLPYVSKTAHILADMVQQDRTPWDLCPRTFLKRMEKQAAQEGFSFMAAFENEFYLAIRTPAGTYIPIDQSGGFSSIGMDSVSEIVLDIIEALAEQGILVQQYYPELGPGQQEISVQYSIALRSADTQIIVRETVRGIAQKHGVIASWAPKPFLDKPGSGSHIHFSLWDRKGKRNLLADSTNEYGLSPLGYHAIGGILKHLKGLIALTAPSFNSYQRLQPQVCSSAFICYGPDNREAAVRIPSPFWGREAESTNLEFKPCDSSCNPYLALGGLIAAALDGIRNHEEPGEPLLQDPALLSNEERVKRGVIRFPQTLAEALNALEGDLFLKEALGGPLAKEYLLVKRSEWEAFKDKGAEFEIAHHFYKY